ncbi:DUF4434 domain-containing protein [Cellulosimicrobium sp. NPDC057862]|uniref:DUF4434 domain-containing protein n=1 Tax=Cellulosimicrobium sp. NPDC057862 TaxID=3346266 RepID=UPI00366A5896
MLAPPTTAATAPASPMVASTFLDPRTAMSWDAVRWDRELTSMRSAGLTTVVLQASVELRDGKTMAYYPSDLPGVRRATPESGAPSDVVGTLLASAKTHGMTVWLGLYRDARPERFAPTSTIATTLAQDASITRAVAAELRHAYSTYRSTIMGWYLPAEINTNYTDEPARSAIRGYYRDVVAHLRAPSHRYPVMVSPYFNAGAGVTPGVWRAFWAQTLTAAPLDVLALQDGAGDIPGVPRGRAELDATLTTWFAATRAAITDARARTALWSNLNLYEFTGAAATVGDVASNARAVRPHVTGYTSFSFTSNYSPWTLGTDRYATVFGTWNTTGTLPTGTPTAPVPGSVTRARGVLTLTWAASTSTSGTQIAYYRLFDTDTGRYLTTVWGVSTTLATTARCASVAAFDVAGNVSTRAPLCAP